LVAKQKVDRKLWKRHVDYLTNFLKRPNYADVAERLNIGDRLTNARKTLAAVEAPEYLQQLTGTIGAEPVENYLTK
jgi:hypothetical protein